MTWPRILVYERALAENEEKRDRYMNEYSERNFHKWKCITIQLVFIVSIRFLADTAIQLPIPESNLIGQTVKVCLVPLTAMAGRTQFCEWVNWYLCSVSVWICGHHGKIIWNCIFSHCTRWKTTLNKCNARIVGEWVKMNGWMNECK